MSTRRTIRERLEQLGQLPADLDLGATPRQIIRRGRRIQRVRQGLVVGAAALAVVGIATTTSLAGHHNSTVVQAAAGAGPGIAPGSTSPAPASSTAPLTSQLPAVSASQLPPPAASPASSTASVASCTPAAQPTAGAPVAPTDGTGNNGSLPPWGALIDAGTDTSGKSLVLYAYHLDDPAIPCTHFGLMLGTKDTASGALSGVTGIVGKYATNEFQGSDVALGFHGTGLSGGGNQISKWYVLGYYVGPAAAISIPENGVPVAATVVPWSVNPDVKVWWVSGADAVPSFGVPSATDAQGQPLPAEGASTPAVG